MKELEFTCTSSLNLGAYAIGHYYVLRTLPSDDAAQTIIIDEHSVDPVEHYVMQKDGWGNLLFSGSCETPHDTFSYVLRGRATVDSSKGRGTDCNEIYRYHSPLTQPGPRLHELHAQAGVFDTGTADELAVIEHAKALSGLTHSIMEYVPGVTNVRTSAEATLEHGEGVCQDYAHVLLALLRMDKIPARYICGLMVGEGATHAWVEFYDGATWWGLDPTNECDAGDGYIVVNRGRDFGDCPMESGIFQGGAMQLQLTHVTVQPIS